MRAATPLREDPPSTSYAVDFCAHGRVEETLHDAQCYVRVATGAACDDVPYLVYPMLDPLLAEWGLT